MRELADELGVSESRISQLRSEALKMLRDGMNAQLEPDLMPRSSGGVAAGRREAYYATIAGRSSFHARLSMPAARTPARGELDRERIPANCSGRLSSDR